LCGNTIIIKAHELTSYTPQILTPLLFAAGVPQQAIAVLNGDKEVGKSLLSDLQEAKKTILIWYAYRNTTKENRLTIRGILSKSAVNKSDLLKMRKIISESGALNYSRKEISNLLRKAQALFAHFTMQGEYKYFLYQYSQELLSL